MLFNSYPFLFLFFPITVVGYAVLNGMGMLRAGLAWLLAASLFFYGYDEPKNLLLIIVSMVTNYSIGNRFVGDTFPERGLFSKKAFLVYGLIFNVGLLAHFKYADFFLENVNAATGLGLPLLGIVLPLGISFFTLQQIRYLVDAYQGMAHKATLLEYSVFVSFFPHLIAGPIVDHRSLLTQFQDSTLKRFRVDNVALGIFVFTIGLAKKVLIADSFARTVADGYSDTAALTLLEGWIVSLSYTFQLYFDFSGYADMAIGAALLFNITMPVNFDSPYKSRGIIEFWKRWHITLSNFITTYLYTPMIKGLNKATFGRAMLITLVAMLVAGLWHGAAWTFVIFGGLHGLGLVINHVWKRKVKRKLPPAGAWALTFAFVNMTFVFFRAPTVQDALLVLKAMAGLNGMRLPLSLEGNLAALKEVGVSFGVVAMPTDLVYQGILLCGLALAIVLFAPNTQQLQKEFRPSRRTALAIGVGFALCCMSLTRISEFLYFNF